MGPARSHILETEIEAEISLYDPKNERVTVLNETASDVWRLVDGERNVDEITELIASSYGLAPIDVATDVAAAIERFAEAGLIENP